MRPTRLFSNLVTPARPSLSSPLLCSKHRLRRKSCIRALVPFVCFFFCVQDTTLHSSCTTPPFFCATALNRITWGRKRKLVCSFGPELGRKKKEGPLSWIRKHRNVIIRIHPFCDLNVGRPPHADSLFLLLSFSCAILCLVIHCPSCRLREPSAHSPALLPIPPNAKSHPSLLLSRPTAATPPQLPTLRSGPPCQLACRQTS